MGVFGNNTETTHSADMKILKHSKVRLITFQGLSNPPFDIDACDNYWNLIGQCGTVIDNELDDKEKVLVLFDEDLDNYQLANHNPIKNSLIIKTKDLEIVIWIGNFVIV